MALFRLNIEWRDESHDTLVYRYPFKDNGREVNNNSTLTVRESQAAIFVYKGKIADVFEPGLYELKTAVLPILTKLAAWKYKFETPITCDVYFVNTKQFTNIKWGTKNPFMMRDPEIGMVRVRGFGAFSFKVGDPGVFLRELFGTNSSYKVQDIQDYARTMLISTISDAIGESKISVLDIAGNTMEFNEIVKAKVQSKFKELGFILTNIFIENMSVPEEVEKALDERSRYGILGGTTDVMMKYAAAEAMKTAAGNQGMGGAFMGAGAGLAAGMGMGNMMQSAFMQPMQQQPMQQQPMQQPAQPAVAVAPAGGTVTCACGAVIPQGSKFCPECGAKMPTKRFCTNCGAQCQEGAKFCPECGNKLG